MIAGALFDGWDIDIVGIKVTEFSEQELEDRIVENVIALSDIMDVSAVDSDNVRERVIMNSEYMDPAYAQPTEEDLTTILEAGKIEGLILGLLHWKGVQSVFRKQRARRTEFIHPHQRLIRNLSAS